MAKAQRKVVAHWDSPWFDIGIETICKYGHIAYYGCIWLVQFRDWSTILVIEESEEQQVANIRRGSEPQENYLMEEEDL